MISNDSLTQYIHSLIPDAEISITDITGSMDHLKIRVVSQQFNGESLLDRHRLVFKALDEPMKDGRIHALEIKTEVPDSDSSCPESEKGNGTV